MSAVTPVTMAAEDIDPILLDDGGFYHPVRYIARLSSYGRVVITLPGGRIRLTTKTHVVLVDGEGTDMPIKGVINNPKKFTDTPVFHLAPPAGVHALVLSRLAMSLAALTLVLSVGIGFAVPLASHRNSQFFGEFTHGAGSANTVARFIEGDADFNDRSVNPVRSDRFARMLEAMKENN